MWIGTASGIARWDGKSIIGYQNTESKNFINGDTRFEFYEDNNKNLWVTHNKGLSIYDKVRDRFNNVLLNSGSYYRVLFEDRGYLFVLTDTNKVSILDIHTKKVVKKKSYPFVIKDVRSNNGAHIKGVNGFYYAFICKNQLFVLNKDTFYTYRMHDAKVNPFFYTPNEIICFVKDSVYILSICKNFHKLKIVRKIKHGLDIKNRHLIDYHYDSINNKHILVSEDKLYYMDDKFKLIKSYSNFFDKDDYTEFFYGVYEDKWNNLYINTNTNGVFIFPIDRRKFASYNTKYKKYNMIKSICVTDDDKLITGQFGSWLTIYRRYTYDTVNLNINNKVFPEILSIENFDADNLLCINSQCFFLFNHKTYKTTSLQIFNETRTNAYPIIKQKQKYLYFNVYNVGQSTSFILGIKPNKKIDTFLVINDDNITSFEWITSNLFLIGTNTHLILYDWNQKKYISVKNYWVKSILKVNQDMVIVGTTDGLYVMRIKENTFKRVNGLPDNLIYGVVEDNKGNIWVSHNKGLSCINLNNGKITNYNNKEGLLSNEFNTGAYYRDKKGNIYFGNVNGVNMINQEKNSVNNKKLNINISQILINDEDINFDSSLNTLKHIRLPYDKNTFSIDFNIIDISNTDKNEYTYYLEGYDPAPVISGKKHFARYTNLPPGDYTLHINGTNSDGVWGNEKIIYLSIFPPFWKTWWFYSLMSVLFLSMLIGIQIFLRNIEKKRLMREFEMYKKVEQERIRISRDLHDNVGANLTFIKNNIEWLLHNLNKIENDNSVLEKHLQQLSQHSVDVVMSLKDTIWALHTYNSTLTQVFDRIKAYCIYLKNNAQLSCQIKISEDIKNDRTLISPLPINIFRIFQEAIHNSIKHSRASVIEIKLIEISTDKHQIQIVDDGVGFKVEEINPHTHGIKNMLQRSKESGFEISIESSMNEGTSITITI
ncbi:MAG: hypothetical protein Fur0023_17520 [Bacteroidia bacterium]